MTTIVLLDSDDTDLDALAQLLKSLRKGWIIQPAISGQQALSIIDTVVVDAIITETNLSDMTGFELLDNVRTTKPDIVRITLSADLGAEVVLENARANHRFIAKPIEPDNLATAIDGSLRLRSVLSNERLTKYMRNVTSLPAIPKIYDDMMQELASPHSSLVKVGEIVESDASLTVTVLKIVNSAFYGLNRRVESVGQAVTLLGVHLIKNITLTAKVFSRFEGSTLSLRRLQELNDQAMRNGALANQFARFARTSRSTADHCQIAGMLSNIGELIVTVKNEGDKNEDQLSADIVGAYLLRVWMMPDAVVEAIAMQCETPTKTTKSVTPLVVLHTIRYLQEHYTDTKDVQQREDCLEYLSAFVPEEIVEIWLDAFQAIEQLTTADSQRAA